MARGVNYNEKVLGNFDWENFDYTTIKTYMKMVDQDFVNDLKLHLGKNILDKPINTRTISDIIKEFHDDVAKEIVTNRDGVVFPHNLGHLMVVAVPKSKRKKYIDFKKTRELGYKVYRKNPETDELYGTLKFSARLLNSRKLKNSKLWTFVKCHKLRDTVSEYFQKNPYKYFQLERHEKLAYYTYSLKDIIKKDVNRRNN